MDVNTTANSEFNDSLNINLCSSHYEIWRENCFKNKIIACCQMENCRERLRDKRTYYIPEFGLLSRYFKENGESWFSELNEGGPICGKCRCILLKIVQNIDPQKQNCCEEFNSSASHYPILLSNTKSSQESPLELIAMTEMFYLVCKELLLDNPLLLHNLLDNFKENAKKHSPTHGTKETLLSCESRSAMWLRWRGPNNKKIYFQREQRVFYFC